MKIGVLRDGDKENRVALLPEHVEVLVKKNISVLIEPDAGAASFADDEAYKNAGGTITGRDRILKESDIILNVSANEKTEIPSGKVLISSLNPLSNFDLVRKLASGKVTSFSLDMVPRSTRAQSVDILSSMATIAGYKAVLLAAGESPRFFPMFMSASGTIRPSRVLILGAGVAGLQALATARKLGAVVEVFDVRSAVKDEVMSLGGKFIEVEGATEDAGSGGYAVEQTEDYKRKQAELIHEHAVKANVVITTAQIPGRKAPLLIKKETVAGMMPGSIVIDMAASTGGNCELTKEDESYQHGKVRIVGITDFPSRMPADASKMLGNNYMNFLKLITTDEGKLELNFEDEVVKGTCITRDGEVVNERVTKAMEV